MQTYFAGLEPSPSVVDRLHGSVIEGWKVTAVCEAPVERGTRTLETPAQVLAFWNEYVVRHPIYTPDQEAFVVFCLNRKCRLIGWQLVTIGTATAALIHPREAYRAAIIANASSIICAHNHPSGDPAPSSADLQITRQLQAAGRAVEISMIDHVVIGMPARDPNGRGYYSFREAGLVW